LDRVPDAPKLDHVAIALHRIADAPPFAVGVLGGRALARGPGAGFRWAQWTFEGGGVLEFLEPDGPPGGFMHRFVTRHGPGVHHCTFKVPDLAVAASRARALGYDVVGYDDSNPGWKECFLHPKQAQGIVVQMAESNDDGPGPEPEADPAAPTPAARVLGLRLVARGEAHARRQWLELLQADGETRGREWVLRWPDSPLRIVIELDPHAPVEGPRVVELACARRLALPEGPHPVLGTAFAQVAGEGGGR
jgi:methylmalonyl-CoA/ethylmalonyl-CoA epimerase